LINLEEGGWWRKDQSSRDSVVTAEHGQTDLLMAHNFSTRKGFISSGWCKGGLQKFQSNGGRERAFIMRVRVLQVQEYAELPG